MIINSLLNENFTGPSITVDPIESPRFTPNMTGMESILFESLEDNNQLETAVMLCEQVALTLNYQGQSERAENLSEGMVGDYFTKFIEMVKKLWAKIKGWFANIVKNIEVSSRDIVKMIEKYKKDLEGKNYANYEYKGHKWTAETPDKLHDGIAKTATEINSKLGTITAGQKSWLHSDTGAYNDKDKDFEDQHKQKRVEKMAKHKENFEERTRGTGVFLHALVNGSANVSHGGEEMSASEAKKELAEKAQGGSAETIKNFSAVSMSAMIDFLKNFKNSKTINAARKEVDKLYANTIKDAEQIRKDFQSAYNSTSSSKEGERAAVGGKLYQAKRNLDEMKNVLTAYSSAVGICVELEKEKFSEFKSAIAGAIRHKGTKSE